MIQLKKLSRNDGLDIFKMLKGIGKEENSFIMGDNTVKQ